MHQSLDLVRALAPVLDSPRHQWAERAHMIVKAVVASVLAWLIAGQVIGHSQAYFAPLAALLGVYPTVARSLRESLAYAGGFLIAILLAVPVGILIGPGPLGIGVVLALALTVSGWHRFGEQGTQIPITALFTLLLGGADGLSYAGPRAGDVAIGLVTGLSVNLLVFPPLHLRRAEYALRELRSELVAALGDLASAAVDPEQWPQWERREDRLLQSADRARYACDHGSDSLRGNPRLVLRSRRRRHGVEWRGTWPAPRQLTVLERSVAYVRSMADTLRDAPEMAELAQGRPFRRDYARQLRLLAGQVRRMPWACRHEVTTMVQERQRRLERPHSRAGTDAPGLWDPQKELLRLSGLMLDDLSR